MSHQSPLRQRVLDGGDAFPRSPSRKVSLLNRSYSFKKRKKKQQISKGLFGFFWGMTIQFQRFAKSSPKALPFLGDVFFLPPLQSSAPVPTHP